MRESNLQKVLKMVTKTLLGNFCAISVELVQVTEVSLFSEYPGLPHKANIGAMPHCPVKFALPAPR